MFIGDVSMKSTMTGLHGRGLPTISLTEKFKEHFMSEFVNEDTTSQIQSIVFVAVGCARWLIQVARDWVDIRLLSCVVSGIVVIVRYWYLAMPMQHQVYAGLV